MQSNNQITENELTRLKQIVDRLANTVSKTDDLLDSAARQELDYQTGHNDEMVKLQLEGAKMRCKQSEILANGLQVVHEGCVNKAIAIQQVFDDLLKNWRDNEEQSLKFLKDLQDTRCAVVRECAQMVGGLKELRSFFGGSNFQSEFQHLKEFCIVLEKLEAFKRNGTLDAAQDFILRLMCAKSQPSEAANPNA